MSPEELVAEILKAAEEARWISEDAAPPGCQAFRATSGAWRLLVIYWKTNDREGYDGAAHNDTGTVCSLPRELAEKFFKAAASQKGIPR